MNQAQKIRRKIRLRSRLIGVCLSFVTLCSLFITINEQTNLLPQLTWKSVYRFFGVGEQPDSDLPCTVRVLDVGAGDCALISSGDETVLIDTGTPASVEQNIAALQRLGIEQLDYLMLSHYHDDHTGGAEQMIAAFSPHCLLLGARAAKDQTAQYQSVVQAGTAVGSDICFVSTGQRFFAGDLVIEVLFDGSGFETENNRSLIVRVTYKECDMLFMGDAEAEVEAYLLSTEAELSAEWVKIAHHGSKTSTTAEFISAVSPAYASISCGVQQAPDVEVLKTLQTLDVQYARTDLHGEILFATDGTKCTMFTENS